MYTCGNTGPKPKGKSLMEKFIIFIVIYFVVVNFVLPRFGLKPG